MKLAFAHSEAGKAVGYIQKVALDLVKARRENGHSDKVPVCQYIKSFILHISYEQLIDISVKLSPV